MNGNNGARTLFLIGARGCGKTSVARELARLLSRPWLDLDLFISERQQRSIAEIVRLSGWEAFRKIESACLKEAAQELGENGILATGGGAPLANENRLFMRDCGHVVWLKAPAETLARRLLADPLAEQRPSLTCLAPVEEIEKVLREREAIYRECAHSIVDGGAELAGLCREIIKLEAFDVNKA